MSADTQRRRSSKKSRFLLLQASVLVPLLHVRPRVTQFHVQRIVHFTADGTALIKVLQAETRGHVFTDFGPHQRLECLRTEEHQCETPEQHTLRDVSTYQTRKTRYHNI